jgi:hypothetical protein
MIVTNASDAALDLWLLTPRERGLRVVGADLPSEHDPHRRRDGRFTPRLRTSIRDLHGAKPIDVADWRDHTPALFTISSARHDTTLDAYSLRGPSHRLLRAELPLPAQNTDRRYFALAQLSGARPDLFVIDRNAQRRKPKREPSLQPWSVRVYSGESDFQRQILHTLIRPKLSRRISKYDWWVDVGPRHREKPDITLVTRERRTGSNRTEIHLLGGNKKYREFSLHAATVLPQRLGPQRQFVFQSDAQGGAVLMLKVEKGQLIVRALPLP